MVIKKTQLTAFKALLIFVLALAGLSTAYAEKHAPLMLSVESPKEDLTIIDGNLQLSGWSTANRVYALVDDEYFGEVATGGSRTADLSGKLGSEKAARAGFGGTLILAKITDGFHTLKIVAENTGDEVFEDVGFYTQKSTDSSPVSIVRSNASLKAATSVMFCQCTNWVARKFGLTGYPNAKDWPAFLKSKGFKELSSPANGAIVVFSPVFKGVKGILSLGSNGHVGISKSSKSDGSYREISLRGANQGGKQFTDANCYDVSDVTVRFLKSMEQSGSVRYFAK